LLLIFSSFVQIVCSIVITIALIEHGMVHDSFHLLVPFLLFHLCIEFIHLIESVLHYVIADVYVCVGGLSTVNV